MSYTRIATLQTYLERVFRQKKLQRYLQRKLPAGQEFVIQQGFELPRIREFNVAEEKRHAGAAGVAYHDIQTVGISRWILADREECRMTIRHELAHFVAHWIHPNKRIRPHGKEFYSALRAVSGPKWRDDLRWTLTSKVAQARTRRGLSNKKWEWQLKEQPPLIFTVIKREEIPNAAT